MASIRPFLQFGSLDRQQQSSDLEPQVAPHGNHRISRGKVSALIASSNFACGIGQNASFPPCVHATQQPLTSPSDLRE